jgi:signal peptidase I
LYIIVAVVAIGALVVGAIFLLARALLLIVTIKNTSMYPALADGDRALVLRYGWLHRLQKGHVAIISSEESVPKPEGGDVEKDVAVQRLLVKRITGLPGEVVTTSLSDLPSQYQPMLRSRHDSNGMRRWRIPAGFVFVQGDNHSLSSDSRIWGPVRMQRVVGRVVLLLPLGSGPVRKQSTAKSDERVGRVDLMRGPTGGPSLIGKTMPPFHADAFKGGTLTLDEIKAPDHHLLLLFTSGPNCIKCVEVIAVCQSLYVSAASKGVDIAIVSITEYGPTLRLATECDIRLPLLVAPRNSNTFASNYGVEGVPHYCLIDTQNRVVACGQPGPHNAYWQALVAGWRSNDAKVRAHGLER